MQNMGLSGPAVSVLANLQQQDGREDPSHLSVFFKKKLTRHPCDDPAHATGRGGTDLGPKKKVNRCPGTPLKLHAINIVRTLKQPVTVYGDCAP